jgi:FixJ family two-component response regulator
MVDVALDELPGGRAQQVLACHGPVSHVFVSSDISGIQALTPGTMILQKPYREPELARAIQRAIGAGR